MMVEIFSSPSPALIIGRKNCQVASASGVPYIIQASPYKAIASVKAFRVAVGRRFGFILAKSSLN